MEYTEIAKSCGKLYACENLIQIEYCVGMVQVTLHRRSF